MLRLPHPAIFIAYPKSAINTLDYHAAVILPSKRTPVVSRELVYTAVTRARRRLSLYADERILSASIATRTERRSGMAALFSSRE